MSGFWVWGKGTELSDNENPEPEILFQWFAPLKGEGISGSLKGIAVKDNWLPLCEKAARFDKNNKSKKNCGRKIFLKRPEKRYTGS